MTGYEAQTRKLLRYMEDGNSITSAEAIKMFDCMRLASRIADLKEAGVHIQSDFEYKLDERGKVVKRWKRYWIAKQ